MTRHSQFYKLYTNAILCEEIHSKKCIKFVKIDYLTQGKLTVALHFLDFRPTNIAKLQQKI